MGTTESIQLVVVTPERKVLKQATSSVVFAAHDGELGVLHNRAPLMCELGVGQLRYQTAGHTHRLYIEGGFAQVYKNTVTVLTQRAIPAENITPETVAEVEGSLEELHGTDPATMLARQQAQQRLSVLRSLRGQV